MASGGNSSSSESLEPFIELPHCCICEEAAVGVGPLSLQHLCREHLSVDAEEARRLQREVSIALRPYSAGQRVAALAEEQRDLASRLEAARLEFASTRQSLLQLLDSLEARIAEQLAERQRAVQTCLADCEDLAIYGTEVAEAEASGDLAAVCKLAMSMQVSVPDLQADFERAQRLRADANSPEQRGLRQLQRLVAGLAGGDVPTSDAACGGPAPVCGPIVASHEVRLADCPVDCVAVWSDTEGFADNKSGCVVLSSDADAGDSRISSSSSALPRPCLVLAFSPASNREFLMISSLDGRVRLRCHCLVNWRDDIRGVHCHGRLLFIAQKDAVTATDFVGHMARRIRPDSDFGAITGVCGNADALFVSNGADKIGRISLATGRFVAVTAVPGARLCSLAVGGEHIVARDAATCAIHRLRIGDMRRAASFDVRGRQGAGTQDVAVDSVGRLFIGQAVGGAVVDALDASDGSLVQVLGCGDGGVRCLAVVRQPAGGGDGRCREHLVVVAVDSDQAARLVVFDLL